MDEMDDIVEDVDFKIDTGENRSDAEGRHCYDF